MEEGSEECDPTAEIRALFLDDGFESGDVGDLVSNVDEVAENTKSLAFRHLPPHMCALCVV